MAEKQNSKYDGMSASKAKRERAKDEREKAKRSAAMSKGVLIGIVVVIVALIGAYFLKQWSIEKNKTVASTDYSAMLNDDGTIKDVNVTDYVKTFDVNSVKIAAADVEYTQEQMDTDIQEELAKHKVLNADTALEVKEGDEVNIDYVGSIDGVEFDGGTAENQTLVIGSGSFIPGFEEQLIGTAIGEEKDVNVTFPADYHAAELAGKEAVFKCKVLKIQKKELPALDDDFAKDVSEFDTLDEYKDDVRKNLLEAKEKTAKTEKENEAVDKLIAASEMDIPDAMVDSQVEQSYEDFAQRMQSQGISMEMYCTYTGQDEAKIKADMRPQALKQIQTRLVLEEVAKAEKIEITDEKLEAEVLKIAEQYGMEADRLKEAVTFIAENAEEV